MSPGTHVNTFPSSWLKRLGLWPRQLTVDVAGYAVTVGVTREEMTQVYLPVLHALGTAAGDGRRMVAGLAGIPGGGKSTLVAVLARMADAVLGMGRLVAVGLDGWHWPNAVLDLRTTTDEAGRSVPLRQRKGGPESFNVEGVAAAVRALQAANGPVSLPAYDRRLHEPLPDRITIGPGTRIVLFEGNFLLDTKPPWNSVSQLLHPKLFIESDPAIARDRVIARHVRGGTAPQQAARKYDTNDHLNTEAVLSAAANADYVIRLGPAPAVLRRK